MINNVDAVFWGRNREREGELTLGSVEPIAMMARREISANFHNINMA